MRWALPGRWRAASSSCIRAGSRRTGRRPRCSARRAPSAAGSSSPAICGAEHPRDWRRTQKTSYRFVISHKEASMKFVKLAVIAGAVLALSALDASAQMRKVKIATEGAYAPWNFVNSQGKLEGFELDLGA